VVSGYQHAIHKGFQNADLARTFYNECLETGVINKLQGHPDENEWFVVSKGVKTGIYTRKYVVSVGLEYRGGTIERITTGRADAERYLRSLRREGKVATLTPHEGTF
ncbi:hypothetical protein K435DRAFT_663130, partial [Dendrothele bispora CBS 962.96]